MEALGLEAELKCPDCPTVNSVTLPCGHNICQVCSDPELEEYGAYSCPECREDSQEFQDFINIMMGDHLSEGFFSVAPEKTEIFCTYCIHSSVPAVKLCLLCESYLCDGHVKVHSKSPEHILRDPAVSPENSKCPIHKEMLRYVCCEDAARICVSCVAFGDHRGHRVSSLNDAFEKKKENLRREMEKLTSKAQQAERRIRDLQERERQIPVKAAGVAERVADLFRDLKRQLDDLERRVLSEISQQEEQRSRSIRDLIQQLEVKKDGLSGRMRRVEELYRTTDPLAVLENPDREDIGDTEQDGECDHIQGVGDLDETLIFETIHTGIAALAMGVQKPPCAREIPRLLLDINTAGHKLILSADRKTATWSASNQNYAETAERFHYNQVLSSRCFSSGQHCWEVETSESGNWRLGMTYPSIDRRGQRSVIGDNDKSWCLRRRNAQCSVIHNSNDVLLCEKFTSRRFRIRLDYDAGRLSFYELCDPIRHIHTFTATFCEPLHLAVLLSNAWVTIAN
ncbi:E3 ubiquitin/ISG15 ligase TRIM25-like [Gastrophryne carolinensis]